jgi:hypothetical protein
MIMELKSKIAAIESELDLMTTVSTAQESSEFAEIQFARKSNSMSVRHEHNLVACGISLLVTYPELKGAMPQASLTSQ